MMKIKAYLEESYHELVKKVSWPSWNELQSSAIIVMVSSLLIAIVVYLMDISFSSTLKFVYSLF